MKRIIIAIAFLFLAQGLRAQFHVEGRLSMVKPLTIEIKTLQGETLLTVDAKSREEFKSADIVLERDLYVIHIGRLSQKLLLENTPIRITGYVDESDADNKYNPGSASNINISGLDAFEKLAPYFDKFTNTNWEPRSRRLNKQAFDELLTIEDPLFQGAVLVNSEMLIDKTYEPYKAVLDNLTKARLDGTGVGKYIAEKEKAYRSFAIGAKLDDLTLQDTGGKMVSVKDFKGKIVMLDFWASWCGPCRAEMKNLVEIYNEIKGDDLVFISISLDDDKEKWLKAVKEENVVWFALWDPDGFYKSKFRTELGFDSIPYILILDKEGNIVVRKLRGESVKEEILKLRQQY